MLQDLPLRSKILLPTIALLLTLAVCAGLVWQMHGETKVGGPVYHNILQGKDLIADVLPPPLYLIEAYMTTLEFANSTNPSTDLATQTLARLKREYTDRQSHWRSSLRDGELMQLITFDLDRSAQDFFNAIDQDFLPALAKSKADAQQVIEQKLTPLYRGQRQAVDRVVAAATKANQAEMDRAGVLTQFRGWQVLACIALGTLLAVALAVYLAQVTGSRIKSAVGLLEHSAKLDLTHRLGFKDRDEIGRISLAIDQTTAQLSDIIREISGETTSLAATAEQISRLASLFEMEIDQLSSQTSNTASSAGQMSSTINTVAAAAEQMSHNTSVISETASEFGRAVSVTSSAAANVAEELRLGANKVHSSSSSLSQIDAEAKHGAQVAVNANEQTEQAVSTIEDLGRLASDISKFSSSIRMIAMQTNLLALNATIEATSAGEAGKGFAVVAQEIKDLANQSDHSASDIAQNTEKVQAELTRSVKAIKSVAELVESLRTSSGLISVSVTRQTNEFTATAHELANVSRSVESLAKSISAMESGVTAVVRNVSEIKLASKAVARSAAESAQAVDMIAQSTTTLDQSTRRQASASKELAGAAHQLKEMAWRLKNNLERFKLTRD